MHLEQTLGNTKKFVTDYYGNRLNTERMTVVSEARATINTYISYWKRLSVKKNTILYEANYGRGMVDNPYAIFCAALDEDRYGKFEHIWVLDDVEAHPELDKYREMRNVRFVEYGSKAYLKALVTSQYLVNNSTFMPYFVPKDEQVYLNTWHGTAIKNMGFDMDGGIAGSANVVRNMLNADYLLSANDVMTEMYLSAFKLQGLYEGKIVEEGYPRNDRSLAVTRDEVVAKLREQGIDADPSKKVILYAPTWRNAGASNDSIDVTGSADELLSFKRDLEERIDTDEFQVLVKPHNFLYDELKDDENFVGKLVPSTIDTNELMAAVDVLVTDFSSIMFDYLVLERPILLYVPDLESYTETRGLKLDIDEMPGQQAQTIDELAAYINDLDKTWADIQPVYQACKQKICPYDDGQVSRRICDMMLLGKEVRTAPVSNEKTRLLFSTGAIVFNGLTRSAMSLLHQIDYDRYDVTVYIRIQGNTPPSFLEEFPKECRVLSRIGAIGFTKREDAIRATYDGFGKFNEVINKTYPRKAFQREARRCLGKTHFDYAIDFNGYEQMMTEIMMGTNSDKKVLWLHSDIERDMNRVVNGRMPNFWHLNHVVSMYPEFDRLVSCGKRVMETNRENFATPETYDRFRYAKNTIDTTRIRAGLQAETKTFAGREYFVSEPGTNATLNLIELPDPKKTTFITVGRCSTEKNHTALVKGFARLHKEYPETELFIVGDGPLMEQVVDTAKDLKVYDAVRFTGNTPNPFIFLKHADCFILPSLFEGQPLVTLEARTCGLPIITSNFTNLGDSLIEGGQLVIEFDEDAIYEGMAAFMRGEVPTAEFDADAYNREAFAEFEAAIQ